MSKSVFVTRVKTVEQESGETSNFDILHSIFDIPELITTSGVSPREREALRGGMI